MRHRLVTIAALLMAVGVFFADNHFLPGQTVPAALYAVPIIMVVLAMEPRGVVAITLVGISLEFIDGLIDHSLPWRLAADLVSLAAVGALGFALVVRMRQRTSLLEDRARLAEEVENERARLESILAQMPAGIVVAEAPSGGIILRNDQQNEIWGRSLSRPLSLEQYQAHYRIFHPDGKPYRPEEHPLYRALYEGESVKNEEASFQRNDGSKGTLRLSSAPILDSQGRIVAAVLVAQDITEQKEAELFREQYIHTISHDLRAPLTIIIGQSQLLARKAAAKEGHEPHAIEAIVTAAKRMNVMIQDMVDAARQESGQLQLALQPTDLRVYMQDLLSWVSPLMDTRRVKMQIPAGLPPVMADANRLERILVNLLSNALKYSPQDTDVLVTACKTDHDMEICVSDRGIGISPEDLPHVFERFYRGQSDGKIEGLGLGLYATKMLVQAHGGRIWGRSQLGEGSTFCFTLPVAPE